MFVEKIVEAIGREVGVRDGKVAGPPFADDFIGMPDTPEGLQKQIDVAIRFARKWRLLAIVNKSAVTISNKNDVVRQL